MSVSFLLLLKPIKTSHYRLDTVRYMGGGPRTFPGGLNKWQWKRLHEKKAKEKEKKLLNQEKQLYSARIRSSIRAELGNSSNKASDVVDNGYGPRSGEEHIKALADRFMKEGAEDMWNEKDGPVKCRPVVGFREPIDVRKLVSGDLGNVFSRNRAYSSYSMNLNDGFGSPDLVGNRWIREEPTGVCKIVSGDLGNGFHGNRICSSYSMNLNDGFRYRVLVEDRKVFGSVDVRKLVSGNLGNGFGNRSYFGYCGSRNLNRAIGKTRSYSVGSMNIIDGFKLKTGAFLCKSVDSTDLIEKRSFAYDGCERLMDSGNGFEAKCLYDCSMNSHDGFRLKSHSFRNGCVDSMNLNDPLTSIKDMKSCDGFKPMDYGVYGSSWKLGNGVISRGNCSSINLNYEIKARNYSYRAKVWKRSRFNFSDKSSDEESEGEEEEREKMGSDRRFTSSAALGKYDKQKTRRVPLKFLDAEEDLSQRVEAIRNEVRQRSMVQVAVDKSDDEDSIISQKRFDECNVSPLTVKALTQAGYVQMTRVQEATLSVSLEGNDALVKAKTGTGKSAAFLLPAIETVLKALNSKKKERAPPVYVLILCPMRELASQIAAEANVMVKYHEGIGVQTLVGGTRFKVDQKQLELNQSQIIVATPGRLLDHIESKSGISVRLLGLKMLILDEADHLLDLGFRKDIEKIVDCLPRERQSLLFSATVPKEVRRISQLVLKREHAYIDTLGLGCVETPTKVKQFKMVVPHDQHFQMVHHLLNEHISQTPDYKVIVFCTTAMVTSLLFLLLREFKMNVMEIHSRKPQLYRSRVSEEFKESKRQILISSDVSARGMNYPDVTLVIQVGIPSDRENYIHRLGRTGREGKDGEGILLLAPWEEYFLDDIKDLPIANFPVPHLDPVMKTKMEQSMTNIDTSVREAAYHAWLGYYNSISEIGRDKTTLAELANQFGQSIGLEKPPSLFRKTALKMGLREIPGIRIRK